MTPDVLRVLLSPPIAFHRVFAEVAGSVAGGLMLSQAWYWTQHTDVDRDGWFYKTRDGWFAETMLSRTEQETARSKLRASGVWEEALRGQPARLWYRVNVDALIAAIEAIAANKPAEMPPSSWQDSRQQDGGNTANIYNAENTAENTAENSGSRAHAGAHTRADPAAAAIAPPGLIARCRMIAVVAGDVLGTDLNDGQHRYIEQWITGRDWSTITTAMIEYAGQETRTKATRPNLAHMLSTLARCAANPDTYADPPAAPALKPSRRAAAAPPPIDAAKYTAPGGKYSHLFTNGEHRRHDPSGH